MHSTSEESGQCIPSMNLEDRYASYASCHRDKINRAIHVICIWPLLWTALALLTQIPIGKLPDEVLEKLPLRHEAWDLHLGAPVVLVYVIVYCVIDPLIGGLASLLVIACYVTANLWMAAGGSVALVAGLHVAGWIAQVYGHLVHEGKAPALMENLVQALLSAPLYILCEILLEFGYNPEMHKRVQDRVDLDSKEFEVADAIKKTAKKD